MIAKTKAFLIVSIFFFYVNNLFAQSNSFQAKVLLADSVQKKEDSLALQKDILDVIHQLFHKKDAVQTATVPKQFIFSVVPSAGYTLSTGLAAGLTGNVAFFTEPKEHENLSSIVSNLAYNQHNQLTFRVGSNIWTKNNKFNLVGDWRIYKFPENTYGLGSATPTDDLNPVKYNFIRFYETVLKELTKNLYGGIGYALDYHYNIVQNSLTPQTDTGYQLYGQSTKSVSSGITYNLLFDNRKNSINPQNGTYINLIYRPNLTWLGSDSEWRSLTFDFRKYIPLSNSGKSLLAFWTLDVFTLSGHPPYFDLPSIGWDMGGNSGRGYVQGRYRGTDMLYTEAEYRVDLTKNGLFGGVFFVNAESFANYPANRFQKIQPGYGPGLRIKFNKRSDTNIAIDYGIGQGSSHGFFVNLGEVF
jgi:outer membrane protein assembly factor BamA